MTRNSKAGDLYKQKKALKKQLDTLEQDKIQPLIVDLYKTLPPKWREILARENVLSRVFEIGKVRMVLRVGSYERQCRELQTLLAEHMDVVIGREFGLVMLTFIFDP